MNIKLLPDPFFVDWVPKSYRVFFIGKFYSKRMRNTQTRLTNPHLWCWCGGKSPDMIKWQLDILLSAWIIEVPVAYLCGIWYTCSYSYLLLPTESLVYTLSLMLSCLLENPTSTWHWLTVQYHNLLKWLSEGFLSCIQSHHIAVTYLSEMLGIGVNSRSRVFRNAGGVSGFVGKWCHCNRHHRISHIKFNKSKHSAGWLLKRFVRWDA